MADYPPPNAPPGDAYPPPQPQVGYPPDEKSGAPPPAYPPQQQPYPPQQQPGYPPQQPGYPPQQPGYPPQQPGYPGPPPPAAQSQGTTNVVVVQQPQPVIQNIRFGSFPVTVTDSNGQQVQTVLQYRSGALTWIVAAVICLFTCEFGLCCLALIPFCINDLKNVYHITPTDGKVVGVYKRI